MTNARKFLVALLSGTALLPASAWAQSGDEDHKKANGDKQADIVVTANSREELREIQSPGVVSVAYPDDVKGEHKSLPDLLDQIPGVYVRRVGGTGGYTTASIRGSSPSQVNIYIDGVPFNTSSEVAADISTIPISNVERVEVYRGTTPARFSGAPLGGAINIVTRTPTGISGNVSAGARSYGGWQAAANITFPIAGGGLLLGFDSDHAQGNFSYPLYAQRSLNGITFGDGNGPGHSYSDPALGGTGETYIDPQSQLPATRTRLNNGFARNNALAKWNNDHFTAKYAYTDLDRYMPKAVESGYSPVDLPQYAYPLASTGTQASAYNQRRQQRQFQHDVALGWHDRFGALTLGVNLNYMNQDRKFRALDNLITTGIGSQYSDYHTFRSGVSVNAAYELGAGNPIAQRFEAQASWSQEIMHADANNLVNVVTGQRQSDYYTRYRRTLANFQVQDTITIRPLGGLEITPVFRVEKLDGPVLGTRDNPFGPSSGNYDWRPTYGGSAKKTIGKDWLIFADIGTYNRYPNFYEIYGDGAFVVAGSDSIGKVAPLLREYGWNLDAGFGWNGTVTGDLTGSFRATYFRRRTENTITFYATPVGAKYINSGTTLTQGGEFEASLVWGKRASLQIAATTQQGHYVDGTYYFFGGFSAAERVAGKLRTLQAPVTTANARLNVNFFGGRLTTYGEVKYTGRNYIGQNRGGGNADDTMVYETPITTFDAGARIKLPHALTLSFGVNDLLNSGPKQKLKGAASADHSYSTCTDPFDFDCLFDPNSTVFEQHPYDTNPYYPRQGRTYYVTLSAGFGASDWKATGRSALGGHESWTGFYIGGALGQARARNNAGEILVFDQNRDGVYGEHVQVAQGLYRNIFLPGFNGRGAAIGNVAGGPVHADRTRSEDYAARFGYDRQFNNLLLGVVAEWSAIQQTDSVSAYSDTKKLTPPFTTAPGILANYVLARQLHSVAALRARAGLHWQGAVGYVTGGPARGDVTHSFSTTNTVNGFTERGTGRSLWGYQVGGGAEVRIMGPFTLGFEFLRTRLDDGDYTVRVGSNGTTPANDAFLNCSMSCVSGTAGQTDMKRTEPKFQTDSLRLTLGYRF